VSMLWSKSISSLPIWLRSNLPQAVIVLGSGVNYDAPQADQHDLVNLDQD